MLIFIVEDDKWYADLLEYQLQLHPDYKVVKYKTGAEMLENMHQKPDIVSLDFRLPDIKGDVLLEKIKAIDPDVHVIIVSGQEDISLAIDLLRKGAHDYIVKNKDARNRFRQNFVEIEEKKRIKDQINQLQNNDGSDDDEWKQIYVGESKAALNIIKEIKNVIKSDLDFCISGELGTGKEDIVRLIHKKSSRSNHNIRVFDFKKHAPEEFYEAIFGNSELKKEGLINECKGGSLLLKNIEDSSTSIQLELLEWKNKSKKNDVRFILSSKTPVVKLLEDDKIDHNLHYKICGFTIKLPPLRERVEDILIITKKIIYNYCEENNLTLIKLSKKAENKLQAYYYPGNTKELQNVVEAAIIRSNKYLIEDTDIVFDENDEELEFIKKEMPLKDYNAKIIQHFLDKYNYDVLFVASKLEIGKSTIYRMINKGEVVLKREKHKSGK